MIRKNKILVTGGAGYIGSVTCHLLVQEKYDLIIIDDLSRGYTQAIEKSAEFIQCSTLDKEALENIFSKNKDIKGVMHFAGSIEVGESVVNPSKYFYNNVIGSLNIIEAVKNHNIQAFIFSSSAAVYGMPFKVPICEESPTFPINPYGTSKLHTEDVLRYYHQAYNLRYAALRYFNACGAYKHLGEHHHPETHLIPNAMGVARGKQRVLNIFGNQYDTPDGTAIRDYVHVEDIASAHILALEALLDHKITGEALNIGNGTGYSVAEIVKTIEKITAEEVPTVITAPRAGDPPKLIADPAKIKRLLGWSPKHNLHDIIHSAWEWYQNYPNGYNSHR